MENRSLSSCDFYQHLDLLHFQSIRSPEQLKYLEQFVRCTFGDKDKLLEVGAGMGQMLFYLQDMNIIGLEREERLIDACICDKDLIVQGDARSMPFANNCFDGVLFLWATLNEFYSEADLNAVLDETFRVCRKGAHIIIDSPVIDQKYIQQLGAKVIDDVAFISVKGIRIGQRILGVSFLTKMLAVRGADVKMATVSNATPWPYRRMAIVARKRKAGDE